MDSIMYVVVPAAVLVLGSLLAWPSIRRMAWLAAAEAPLWRKTAERVALSLAVALIVAVSGWSTYNAIAIQLFLAANPPRGHMYSVSGRKMHLYCVGSGEPTVLLEPGLGPATDVLSWGSLQPKLARAARVCSYDRAGLGWSESQPGPRDADRICADLHELLRQAGVSAPLVLLGTSYGGIYIRNYTAHYPEGVAALVLVDSSTPFQEERFQAALGSRNGNPGRRLALLQAGYLLGLARLEGWCGRPVPGWERRAATALGEDACMPRDESRREYLSMAQSSAEAARAGPFGALPILIFSHDPGNVLSMKDPPREWAIRERLWDTMQEELRGLSTRSRRIVARGSGHGVQIDREELVVKEVVRLLDQIRGGTLAESNWGSTTVE